MGTLVWQMAMMQYRTLVKALTNTSRRPMRPALTKKKRSRSICKRWKMPRTKWTIIHALAFGVHGQIGQNVPKLASQDHAKGRGRLRKKPSTMEHNVRERFLKKKFAMMSAALLIASGGNGRLGVTAHLDVIRQRPESDRWLSWPPATALSAQVKITRRRFAPGKRNWQSRSEHCWMKMRAWEGISAQQLRLNMEDGRCAMDLGALNALMTLNVPKPQ